MARILIVEDDTATATFVQDVLQAAKKKYYQSTWEMRFDHAKSAAEALKYIETRNYELVVTDILMAKMDGWELIKVLRKDKSRSQLPVLVITAIDGIDIRYESIRRGATDGFAKPIKGDELKRFIKVVFNLILER